MNKISCYNGMLYKIEYKPELSQKDYTQRHVYYIKTNDKNYLRAHNAIKSIMNDGSWERGEWEMWNDQQPSMENALHTYHEFKYNEELGVYVYTFIRPYDD